MYFYIIEHWPSYVASPIKCQLLVSDFSHFFWCLINYIIFPYKAAMFPSLPYQTLNVIVSPQHNYRSQDAETKILTPSERNWRWLHGTVWIPPPTKHLGMAILFIQRLYHNRVTESKARKKNIHLKEQIIFISTF